MQCVLFIVIIHIATQPLQQANQTHSATITGVDTMETQFVMENSPKSVCNANFVCCL